MYADCALHSGYQAYLGHVPGGVGILSSEDGADAVYSLPTTGNLKLLVELGGLSKEGSLVKVGHGEDVGTALGRGADEARGLELGESSSLEIIAEKLAHSHAHISNGLLHRRPLVHGGVVEVGAEGGIGHGVDGQRGNTFLDRLSSISAGILVFEAGNCAIGDSQAHAEYRRSRGDEVALGDVELVVGHLAALDGVEGLCNLGLDHDEALQGKGAGPLDHLFGHGGALGSGDHHTLDGPVPLLAKLDKGHLGTLQTRVLDPGPEPDDLVEVLLAEVPKVHALGLDLGGGRYVAVVFLGKVLGGAAGGLCSSSGSLPLGSLPGLLGLLLSLGLGLLSGLFRGAGALSTGVLSRGGGGGLGVRRGRVGHCRWLVQAAIRLQES